MRFNTSLFSSLINLYIIIETMNDEIKDQISKGLQLIAEAVEKSNREVEQSTDLIPFREAMEKFRVSRNTMYRLERDGTIKVHRVTPRKLFVSLSQMEEAFKNR